MDDALRVRVRKARQHALEHAADLRRRELADPRAQRSTRDVLHRDVRRAVVLEEVEHGHDARVIERAREPRLAHEASGHLRVLAVQRPQLLQRGVAVEVELAGEMDTRHAAAAELPHDLVAADAHQRIFGAPPSTVN